MGTIIHTDGSAQYKDGTAGWGIVYQTGPTTFYGEFGALPPESTISQARMIAVIRALSNPNLVYPVTVFTDSKLVEQGMGDWGIGWLTRELRDYGVGTWPEDTVISLYQLLKKTTKNAPLQLKRTSSEDDVRNIELWEQLWQVVSDAPGDIYFEWTAGHDDKNFWNTQADTLAKQGRELAYEKHGIQKPTVRDRRIR